MLMAGVHLPHWDRKKKNQKLEGKRWGEGGGDLPSYGCHSGVGINISLQRDLLVVNLRPNGFRKFSPNSTSVRKYFRSKLTNPSICLKKIVKFTKMSVLYS